MKFQVPESERDKLAKLVRLSPEKLDVLSERLSTVPPKLRASDLVKELHLPSDVDESDAVDVVRLLLSLHWLRSEKHLDAAEVASGVVDAAKELGEEKLKPPSDGWEAFANRLTRLLSLDRTLGVTSKALFVSYQYPRHFHSGRIMTDARPIFGAAASDPPAAFVIVHTLKIDVHEDGDDHEVFFALNAADLQELRTAIDRALEKEKSLKHLLVKTGVPSLDWEDLDRS